MANMITKVVRSGAGSGHGAYFKSGSQPKSNPANYMTSRVVVEAGNRPEESSGPRRGRGRESTRERGGSAASDIELAAYPGGPGIMKTVETKIVVDSGDESRSNRS